MTERLLIPFAFKLILLEIQQIKKKNQNHKTTTTYITYNKNLLMWTRKRAFVKVGKLFGKGQLIITFRQNSNE